MDRINTIQLPILLLVGENTEPQLRNLFQQSLSPLKDLRVGVLPGQRHTAHQTAPGLLARSVTEFLLDA